MSSLVLLKSMLYAKALQKSKKKKKVKLKKSWVIYILTLKFMHFLLFATSILTSVMV